MELTGIGVVVFLALLFAGPLSSVLRSIAFRNRAAGRAEVIRAQRERAGKGRRAGKRGRRG
ncbi:hypothetical protein J8N05_46675 (plasmid) [Streptomyces sp. BH-SS-21]|uniref:Uncharacterized protein n=1 Tax=Streptomyces liliiviolaceus TaxID=2823109 RepID=A0A940Y6V0_9ACTN|nr:hypothetical protein [Streptomyces liliiviolaceus]MBQ0855648.1 hypothetical protein [Streptomyces liliiviolaceus]